MGQEIFYCARCQVRLTGAELDRGEAVRVGNRVACKGCAGTLLAQLAPEESEPKPGTRLRKSTGKIPIIRPARPASPPRPAARPKEPEAAPEGRAARRIGVAVGVVVGVGLLAALMNRSSPPPPADPEPTPYVAPIVRSSPAVREEGPHHKVRAALEAVRKLLRDPKADPEAAIAAAEDAVKAAEGTPLARDAGEVREAALARRRDAWSEELSKVEGEASVEEARGEYGRAVAILEGARKVRTAPEWGAKVDQAVAGLRRREAERTGGLVGWWKLDGSASDATSRGRHGKTRWSVEWGEGKIGRAAHFPTAGEISIAPFAFESKSVTLAAWVKHDSIDDHVQRYVTLGDETAVLRHERGKGRLHFYVRSGGELRSLRVEQALDTVNWHHVAGTWDGTAQRLYIDGVLRASATPPAGALAGADRLAIGAPEEFMHGWIDDVRVYDRALSEEEVREIGGFSAAERPWRALFDGQTLQVLNPQCHNAWKVEGGAIVRTANNAAQSAEEFGDGEIRFRFEGTGLEACFFRVRQGSEGGFAVTWDAPSFAPLSGKPHDLVFTQTGDQVTATLDGSPMAVTAQGKARSGRFQFNAVGGTSFRVLSIDVR
ncbi:MAG TPA: LamG domain-containing protein [Planctomycetota bacterium]|jgi:hypothetical protein|nr:LamG domain-containing protein [Planctomycetota bacterium]